MKLNFKGFTIKGDGVVVLTGVDPAEYLAYKQQHLMNTDEEFWDFSIDDLTNGAVEPNDNVYVEFPLEDGEIRYGETDIPKGAFLSIE